MLLVQQNICPRLWVYFYFCYQLVRKLQKYFFLTNILNASEKYKRSVLQKRLLYHIPVDVHECNLRFVKQESQLLLRWADRTIPESQRPILGRGKKTVSQSDCSPINAMVTLLYWMYSQRQDTIR